MTEETFLIIDESDANRLFFQVCLKDLGYNKVIDADSGAKGLELLNTVGANYLIVAWEMDQMPGTTLVQKARSTRKRKHLPFLIFSKTMSEQDVQLTSDLGMNNILPMPFDKDTAKEMITNMVESEKNISKVQKTIRKINSFLDSGTPNEALKLMLEYMNRKGPDYVESKVTQAEVWIFIRKYDKAEKCLNDALEYNPECADALQLLAKVYSETGKHDEAIETLEKLMETSPMNLSVKVGLGSALTEADRPEEAKVVINEVLEIDQDCQGAKDEMGKVAFKEGNYDLATSLLSQTDNGHELGRFFNNIGIAKIKKANFDEGIDIYHKAIKLLESSGRQYLLKYNLGLAYKKLNNPAESFHWFAQSYLDNPSYEKAYANMADSFKKIKSENIEYDKELVKRVKETRSESKNSEQTEKAA